MGGLIGYEHNPSSCHPLFTSVQHIRFPKHFQDQPDDVPRCKGFALITLSSLEQVNALTERWPWQRQVGPAPSDCSPLAHEAFKFGFRTLPQVRWATLNERYKSYQQLLLDQAATKESLQVPFIESPQQPKRNRTSLIEVNAPASGSKSRAETSSRTTTDSFYPHDCLVFVRNVHPETNKTTLRSFFSLAFTGTTVVLPPGDGLDYVDFNKHMNTVSIAQHERKC